MAYTDTKRHPHETMTNMSTVTGTSTAGTVDSDTETEPDVDESRIDPELRLRTVRTAASTIAEGNRQEERIAKRRRLLGSLRKGKGKGSTSGGGAWKLSLKRRRADAVSTIGEADETATVITDGGHTRAASVKSATTTAVPVQGQRRNIYVNRPLPAHELNQKGEPAVHFTRNKVRTTSESPSQIQHSNN
jgi:phospholipid-translocating ATPase